MPSNKRLKVSLMEAVCGTEELQEVRVLDVFHAIGGASCSQVFMNDWLCEMQEVGDLGNFVRCLPIASQSLALGEALIGQCSMNRFEHGIGNKDRYQQTTVAFRYVHTLWI